MMGYPIGAENDDDAPYNQSITPKCPICTTEMVEDDTGEVKGKKWTNWKCPVCGEQIINEPWDYED